MSVLQKPREFIKNRKALEQVGMELRYEGV